MSLKMGRPLVAIVDDDASTCASMRRLINAHGIDAQIFTSGREFIELLDSTPSFRPDCVILDIHMPDLNGLEVQLQLSWRRSSTPVIFVTAANERWVHEEAMAAGATAFFLKPCDAEVIMAAVQTALKPQLNS